MDGSDKLCLVSAYVENFYLYVMEDCDNKDFGSFVLLMQRFHIYYILFHGHYTDESTLNIQDLMWLIRLKLLQSLENQSLPTLH